ncbi:hypothetical protein Tco_0529313 [Tanacetum coccineum]
MRIGTSVTVDEVIGDEYVVEDVRDHVDDNDHGRLRKRKSRFTLLAGDLGLDSSRRGFNKEKFIDGIRSGCSPGGLFIHPENSPEFGLAKLKFNTNINDRRNEEMKHHQE